MKLATPKFIIGECERLIEALPEEYKDGGRGVLRRLNQANTLDGAMKSIQYMYKYVEVASEMNPKLFRKKCITKDLLTTMVNYGEKEVVRRVFDFIESKKDEDYQIQTFRLIKSQEEWKKVSVRGQIIVDEENYKIAVETWYPQKTRQAEKAYYELCYCYEGRWIENCTIWFQLGQRACYNIYLNI